jgi:hypothetical protein
VKPRSRPAALSSALRYAWTSPNTLLGCLFVLLALASGGTVRVLEGVIEAHGGWLRPLLRGFLLLPGGARAVTFGHVVLARTEVDLEDTRVHERAHVRQYERWGPLFLGAYLVSSVWAWSRGRGAYRGNRFEREAFEQTRR